MRKENTNKNRTSISNSLMKALTPLLYILFVAGIHTAAFSQQAITDSITKKLNEHRLHHLQEKLYLHTSKSFYVTGEIIWFKVYTVDGYLHQALSLSKVAYVEVISEDGKPMLQAKIDLKEGNGNGTFLIPPAINTGNYILRAYTAWMKNFDANYYFHQPITIVNTLKRPDWQKLQKAVSYDFQLYPEGGNLVQGIESKVAFRLVNSSGKGQVAEGVIVNASNDTIQHFKTHRFGMGHFRFKPEKGQRYKAVARLQNGEQIATDLPSVHDQGTVMTLEPSDQGQVNVTVATNTSDEMFYLLVHCRQVAKVVSAGAVVNGKVRFTLNKSELGDGINHFTLFNKVQQPLCERLYFNRPQNGLAITAKTPKAVYSTREKVDVSILTQDSQQKPVAAQLSLSVHLADPFNKELENNIESYLLLTSDLKGTIEHPTYYFTQTGTDVAEALDNLMLTHGWSRYKWEEIFAASTAALTYLPEYEGHIVQATITNKQTGQVVSNMPSYLTVPGSRPYLSYAVSSPQGKLQFVMKRLQGMRELMVQSHSKTDSLYTISINNPFSTTFAALPTPAFNLAESQEAQLVKLNKSTQVQNNFMYAKYQQFVEPAYFDTTAFYGQPDKTYYLDDYTRFTTMEEVMREYVAEVRVRKQENGFHYEVKNTPYQSYFKNNPLVLLDGALISDINKIMAVDPLKIRKIDVVARKYFWGSLTFDGIVSYSSYNGSFVESLPGAQALMVAYEGTQLQREFYTPVYETKEQHESRLPDFRNQLHWEPNLRTTTNGQQTVSFYTSDLEGDYVLTIQGITAEGLPGSTTITIRVNK